MQRKNLATRIPNPGLMLGATRISRRRAAQTNLMLGYGRYAVGIFNQLILVPLYLRFISIGAYGSWLASGNVVALLSVLDIGFNLIVTQRLATAVGAGDDNQFVREVGSSLGVVLAGAVFVSAVAFILSPWIPAWINAPASQTAALRRAIVLTGIGAAAEVISLSMWSVLQAWQLAFLCEFNLLISSVLGLTATVIALFRGIGVVAFGVGVLVAGTSAAVLLISVVALQWRRRKLPLPTIRLRVSSELFRYSSPVIISRITLSLVNNGQSVIVSACLNPTAAAILSLSSRLFTGCRTLLEPIIGSSFAGIAHLIGESAPHSSRVRTVLKELFTIIGVSAALMFGMAAALNVSFGRLWVGPDRFSGVALTIVICMATLAVSINNVQGVIVTALGNIRGPAWCSLLEVGIRVPLTIVFLLYLGIIGAPLAACATSLAIGSWYLFRLLRRKLSLRTVEALEIVGGGLPALAACLSVSVAAALVLSPATTWFALIRRGALMAIVLVTLVVALTPYARRKAGQVVMFLSSWRRKAAPEPVALRLP
jgi:O-antigen/teichoic acid export membrane protein